MGGLVIEHKPRFSEEWQVKTFSEVKQYLLCTSKCGTRWKPSQSVKFEVEKFNFEKIGHSGGNLFVSFEYPVMRKID